MAKRAVGQPTKYTPKHAELAFWMAKAGLTDKQIAQEMSVTEQTINNWKKAHPEFFEALKRGKATPDDAVEAALLRRAKGFTYQEGDRSRVALPDTTACIFWLKNRRPGEWRDKQQHEPTGKGGGPIQRDDLEGMSNEELEERLKILRGE